MSFVNRLSADSTLTGFVMQLGLLGAMMFYGVLMWAGLHDRTARPFLGIVAICSLTINVTELFPLNCLLGLALAHAIFTRRRNAPIAAHA